MDVIRDKKAMRRWSRSRRAAGERIGFVPTMGYLHEGHLSLLRAARERADVVVASIYVNPTQFAPSEDFEAYPRDEVGDLALLRDEGVHAAFCPRDLYAGASPATSAQPDADSSGSERAGAGRGELPHETWVDVTDLAQPLCGASRPGFFRGVATVVTKLFHVVEPDVAVFGKKDYQQWRVIERMCHDLDLPVEIVGMPTVREADGLAMSARNVRLSERDRKRALAVPETLELAERAIVDGERDAARLRGRMEEHLGEAGLRVDYTELVDRYTLESLAQLDRPALAAVAAYVGDVRLIDNRELPLPGEPDDDAG